MSVSGPNNPKIPSTESSVESWSTTDDVQSDAGESSIKSTIPAQNIPRDSDHPDGKRIADRSVMTVGENELNEVEDISKQFATATSSKKLLHLLVANNDEDLEENFRIVFKRPNGEIISIKPSEENIPPEILRKYQGLVHAIQNNRIDIEQSLLQQQQGLEDRLQTKLDSLKTLEDYQPDEEMRQLFHEARAKALQGLSQPYPISLEQLLGRDFSVQPSENSVTDNSGQRQPRVTAGQGMDGTFEVGLTDRGKMNLQEEMGNRFAGQIDQIPESPLASEQQFQASPATAAAGTNPTGGIHFSPTINVTPGFTNSPAINPSNQSTVSPTVSPSNTNNDTPSNTVTTTNEGKPDSAKGEKGTPVITPEMLQNALKGNRDELVHLLADLMAPQQQQLSPLLTSDVTGDMRHLIQGLQQQMELVQRNAALNKEELRDLIRHALAQQQTKPEIDTDQLVSELKAALQRTRPVGETVDRREERELLSRFEDLSRRLRSIEDNMPRNVQGHAGTDEVAQLRAEVIALHRQLEQAHGTLPGHVYRIPGLSGENDAEKRDLESALKDSRRSEQALKRSVVSLESRLKELASKQVLLEEMENEKVRLKLDKVRLEGLESEKDRLEHELEEARSSARELEESDKARMEALVSEKDRLEYELEEARSSARELEESDKARMEGLVSEKDRLEHELEEARSSARELEESDKARLEALVSEKDRLEHELEQAKSSARELDESDKARLEGLESEKVRLEHELEEAEQARKTLETKDQAKQGELERKITELEHELEEAKSSVRELEESDKAGLEGLVSEKARLEHELEESEQARKTLETKDQAKQGELESKITELEQALEEAEQARKTLETEDQAKQGELESKITELEQALDKAVQARKTLEAEDQAKQGELESKITELEQVLEEAEQARKTLETNDQAKQGGLETKITELEQALDKAVQAKQVLEETDLAKQGELESKITELEQKLDRAVQARKTLETEDQAKQGELESKITELEQALDKAIQARKSLKTEDQAKQGELESKITGLEQALDKAVQAKQALEETDLAKQGELESKITKLEQGLKETNRKNLELEREKTRLGGEVQKAQSRANRLDELEAEQRKNADLDLKLTEANQELKKSLKLSQSIQGKILEINTRLVNSVPKDETSKEIENFLLRLNRLKNEIEEVKVQLIRDNPEKQTEINTLLEPQTSQCDKWITFFSKNNGSGYKPIPAKRDRSSTSTSTSTSASASMSDTENSVSGLRRSPHEQETPRKTGSPELRAAMTRTKEGLDLQASLAYDGDGNIHEAFEHHRKQLLSAADQFDTNLTKAAPYDATDGKVQTYLQGLKTTQSKIQNQWKSLQNELARIDNEFADVESIDSFPPDHLAQLSEKMELVNKFIDEKNKELVEFDRHFKDLENTGGQLNLKDIRNILTQYIAGLNSATQSQQERFKGIALNIIDICHTPGNHKHYEALMSKETADTTKPFLTKYSHARSKRRRSKHTVTATELDKKVQFLQEISNIGVGNIDEKKYHKELVSHGLEENFLAQCKKNELLLNDEIKKTKSLRLILERDNRESESSILEKRRTRIRENIIRKPGHSGDIYDTEDFIRKFFGSSAFKAADAWDSLKTVQIHNLSVPVGASDVSDEGLHIRGYQSARAVHDILLGLEEHMKYHAKKTVDPDKLRQLRSEYMHFINNLSPSHWGERRLGDTRGNYLSQAAHQCIRAYQKDIAKRVNQHFHQLIGSRSAALVVESNLTEKINPKATKVSGVSVTELRHSYHSLIKATEPEAKGEKGIIAPSAEGPTAKVLMLFKNHPELARSWFEKTLALRAALPDSGNPDSLATYQKSALRAVQTLLQEYGITDQIPVCAFYLATLKEISTADSMILSCLSQHYVKEKAKEGTLLEQSKADKYAESVIALMQAEYRCYKDSKQLFRGMRLIEGKPAAQAHHERMLKAFNQAGKPQPVVQFSSKSQRATSGEDHCTVTGGIFHRVLEQAGLPAVRYTATGKTFINLTKEQGFEDQGLSFRTNDTGRPLELLSMRGCLWEVAPNILLNNPDKQLPFSGNEGDSFLPVVNKDKVTGNEKEGILLISKPCCFLYTLTDKGNWRCRPMGGGNRSADQEKLEGYTRLAVALGHGESKGACDTALRQADKYLARMRPELSDQARKKKLLKSVLRQLLVLCAGIKTLRVTVAFVYSG